MDITVEHNIPIISPYIYKEKANGQKPSAEN